MPALGQNKKKRVPTVDAAADGNLTRGDDGEIAQIAGERVNSCDSWDVASGAKSLMR